MKIGDEVYIHGYVDEIRKDTVIIRNDGGYFGTVSKEITAADSPLVPANKIVESLESMERDMRTFGNCEKANGVASALWLIEEMVNREELKEKETKGE